MATSAENDVEKGEPPLEVDDHESNDVSAEEKPSLGKPYLWIEAKSDYEDGDFTFSGFEPCYIACIKDLEWQISEQRKLIDLRNDDPKLARDMTPLLIKYSQLIQGLEQMRSRERNLHKDHPGLVGSDLASKYAGVPHSVSVKESDRAHEALRDNMILIVLDFIYKWDVADDLKRRYGNLTRTLERMVIGIAGGASLLVPMIIMTWVREQDYRLIVVSAATVLFAAVVACWTTSKDNVISATAAYAAVLVVYVGSSSTKNNG